MSVTFAPLGGRVDWDNEDGSWANFANGNAAAMVRLLNLPDEGGYGQIAAADVASVRQRIFVLLNKDKAREPAIRETETSMGIGQPTVISMGIDDDYIVRRLKDLDRVLEACQAQGVGLGWA